MEEIEFHLEEIEFHLEEIDFHLEEIDLHMVFIRIGNKIRNIFPQNHFISGDHFTIVTGRNCSFGSNVNFSTPRIIYSEYMSPNIEKRSLEREVLRGRFSK